MRTLRFEYEWEQPASVRGAVLRATWAAFQLWINDECLTRVFDHRSKSIRTCVYIPLYPLAEWIAWNWWFLLYEPAVHGLRQSRRYPHRHDLRHVGDGIALPGVEFRPVGGAVLVSWSRKQHQRQRVEFLGQGTAMLDHDQFSQCLFELVEGCAPGWSGKT